MSKKTIGVVIVVVLLVIIGGYFLWSKYGVSMKGDQGKNPESSDNVAPSPGGAASTKKVKVITPNGGETWQRGKQYNVRWDTTLVPAGTMVSVSLIKTSSVISDPYAVSPSRITGYELFTPANFPQGAPKEGTYNYLVPPSLPAGTYQLLVWAGAHCSVTLPKERCDFDLSNALFTIK